MCGKHPVHFSSKYFLLALALFAGITILNATGKTKSVVLKSYEVDAPPLVKRYYNTGMERWEEFKLIHDANNGDPLAQHELGLRYLIGEGVQPDTGKAAYWIMKAAGKKLPLACYNYGILLNNGLGIQWNPFEAYRQFKFAASQNIPQANYLLGIFFTDNLTVPRNIHKAYELFKIAADSGFSPAKEVLDEFVERGWAPDSESTMPLEDTASTISGLEPTSDFSDSLPNNNSASIFQTLLHDAQRTVPEEEQALLNKQSKTSTTIALNTRQLDLISETAAWGNPESLVMLGWSYEQGSIVKKDVVQATAYYLQAMRYGSVKGHILLLRLLSRDGYFQTLKKEVDNNNVQAQTVWSKLIASGLDYSLTEAQAVQLLESSAAKKYPDAIVDLALCFDAGTWVKQDKDKAQSLFAEAAGLGNNDAKLRLISLKIFRRQKENDTTGTLSFLFQASENGSQLAQEILGACYEKGMLVPINLPDAVRYYRLAAQHGSESAINALKKLYDSIRPDDKEFMITEK